MKKDHDDNDIAASKSLVGHDADDHGPTPSSKEHDTAATEAHQILPYDPASTSRTVSLSGLALSVLFGIFCLASGIYIALSNPKNAYAVALPKNWPDPEPHVFSSVVAVLPKAPSTKQDLLRIVVNIFVTVCTDAIGFVHAVTLRAALTAEDVPHPNNALQHQRESRLRFNTNLRLLTAAHSRPWTNPNGTRANTVMALLLILSYAASSLVMLPFTAVVSLDALEDSEGRQWKSTCIFAAPVLILGVAILLQAGFAAAGVRTTCIVTWSSSPLDTTAALLHDGHVTHVVGRCMCSVEDAGTKSTKPQKPVERQSSGWRAHASIRRTVAVLCTLIPVSAAWGGIVYGVWRHSPVSPVPMGSLDAGTPHVSAWSFLPDLETNTLMLGSGVYPALPATPWVICLIIFIIVQGALTLALHCAELVVNVARDEGTWRAATSKRGTKPPSNPLVAVLSSWPNVLLLIAKPILHWMFGLCVNLQGTISPDLTGPEPVTQVSLEVVMRPIQIWYFSIVFAVFAAVFTLVSNIRPVGPQPATYGHIQTLANLVDEWPESRTMWWGHKEDGETSCHAGTSDHPLPPVKMNRRYAGM